MNKPILTLFCGIFIIFINTAISQKLTVPQYELKLKYFFPSDKEDETTVWLAQAIAMARTQSGLYFVCNNKEKSVVKFDPSGKFLGKIGQPGQGPGDFLNIAKVFAGHQSLMVFDSMKHDISFLSHEGKFLRSIKLFKSYRDLAFDGQERFYAAVHPRGAGSAHLVDVLDQNGNYLFSFGDPVHHFGDNRDIYLNEIKIACTGESVVVLFTNIAMIRRFGKDGRLHEERTFDEFPGIQDESRKNIKRFQNMVPGRAGYRHLFDAVDQANGRWYLLRNSENGVDVIETESDLSTRAVYTYSGSRSWESLFMDFEVTSTVQGIEFSLLKWIPESRVEIMIPAIESR